MFAIWFLPNEKDANYIEEIINKFSIKFNVPKFKAHLTIYGLIDLDYDNIKKIVNESISGLSSFYVFKKGIEQSEDNWKSIFINIENNEKLVLTNKKLHEKFKKFEKNEFSPHISLLYGKFTKLEKFEILKKLKIKNKIKIDRIAILKFSNNVNEWKIIKTFKLYI